MRRAYVLTNGLGEEVHVDLVIDESEAKLLKLVTRLANRALHNSSGEACVASGVVKVTARKVVA